MFGSFLNDSKKRLIEHHLSSILGIGFLFAFGLGTGILSLNVKGPGTIVEIRGPLRSLQRIQGSITTGDLFEFSVKNQAKIFTISDLGVADQNLLVSVEKPGTEFKFTVEKNVLEQEKKIRVPVLSLSSPNNVYLAEKDLRAAATKDRVVLLFLSLLAFAFGLWFVRFLQKSMQGSDNVSRSDNRSIDPIVAWVAYHPRLVFGGGTSLLLFIVLSLVVGLVAGLTGSAAFYAAFFFWFRRRGDRFPWLKAITEKDSTYRLNQLSRPTTVLPKYFKAIQLLIKAEKINIKDIQGRTPLHIVIEADLTEAIGLLLKAGADPNLQNSTGDTPLMLATRAGRLGAVMKLVEAGAIVKIENVEKETALSIAKQGKHRGLSDYLSRTAAHQELTEQKAAEAAALEATRAERAAVKG